MRSMRHHPIFPAAIACQNAGSNWCRMLKAHYRRGFFLGDGTGAGKGRQLASILMDQWLRGLRRHLWISESNALIEDARRDWQALGGIALDIQPLSKIKPKRGSGRLMASCLPPMPRCAAAPARRPASSNCWNGWRRISTA
jgi:hypothetical protein